MIYNTDPLPLQYHILYKGDIDGVKGTNIEQYYSDYKHIRIVPFQTLIKKIDQNSEKDFGLCIREFTELLSNGQKTTEDFFVAGIDDNTANSKYRRIIKMHWLINSIQTEDNCEPITVSMAFHIGNYDASYFTAHVHPGSFRRHAFDLLDSNHPCIVFDPFCIFPECKKANLNDILELYDSENTILEIALMPSEHDYNTPQILNMHSKSKNSNMTKNILAWEKRTHNMWNKPINIFIGYDRTHKDATNVCHNSIQDNLGPLNNFLKIHHLDVTKIHGWTREYKDQSTEFTYSRFLVPYLSNYEGMSIFCDNDFIFTENILNLLWFISPDNAVACVKHNFEHKYDKKFTDTKDVWYDKKLWSSLMVFNNAHPDCKKLTLDKVMSESGKYLHQFEWTNNIDEIPKKWNWCEGYSDLKDIHQACGLHWTRGGPWIEDMDCTDIEGLDLYDAYKTHGHEGYNKWRTVLDLRQYFDLDNPYEELSDGSLMCNEINRDVR